MSALSELKPRFRKTFYFIVKYIHEHGYAPTTQDITDGVPLSSKSVASFHRDKLVDKNLLAFDPDRARSISIVGALTLTFFDDDAEYLRGRFGEISGHDLVRELRNEEAAASFGKARS